MNKQKILEKLIKDGYKDLGVNFSKLKIYGKGDLRVLYNQEKDYIVLKYSMNEGYLRSERIKK
jgi:hypothetical protein